MEISREKQFTSEMRKMRRTNLKLCAIPYRPTTSQTTYSNKNQMPNTDLRIFNSHIHVWYSTPDNGRAICRARKRNNAQWQNVEKYMADVKSNSYENQLYDL